MPRCGLQKCQDVGWMKVLGGLLLLDWGSTVWGSRAWGSRGSGDRFCPQLTTHLFSEKRYRGSFNVNVV